MKAELTTDLEAVKERGHSCPRKRVWGVPILTSAH